MKHDGCFVCKACGFDFSKRYGSKFHGIVKLGENPAIGDAENLSFCKLPSAGEQRMSEGRGFLIAFQGAGQCCFKGGERNYSSDAPSRREDRYCVGDIPKEALNNRLKWAESLKPHL